MAQDADRLTLFLCGDVMTGRGIDQILPHPAGHQMFEPYVQDAREYVSLAEARNGSIPRPAGDTYIWGDARSELARVAPHVRIVNLETSITASDDHWPGKGIHYRMHPENVSCLTAAGLDVCSLANNHVMDYGYAGLAETLDTARRVGLKAVGAGRTMAEAQAPAIVERAHGTRVIVLAFGTGSSGIPVDWAARDNRAGVALVPDLSEETGRRILERIPPRHPGDVVVASVHWGSNWGYEVPDEHVRFAHLLIDGGVDVVHGHSSHHPRPIEVYHDRLILYGCGDFINDYEGIEGYEQFRGDLVLMYFATLSAEAGTLTALEMTPLQVRRFRLNRTQRADAAWLRDTLERVSASRGCHIHLTPTGTLTLSWE